MNLPSQSLPLPTAYYDKNSSGFWHQDSKMAWMRLKEGDFVRFLTEWGYSGKPAEGEALSAVSRALMKIQMEQNVDYAGPVAGYGQGIISMEGKSVLVTDSPKIIEPVAGDYRVLQTMLLGMFGEEQLLYFQAWLKLAYESLSSGKLRPGQAVVLAGPRNSGKSLLQQIVTQVLGGRVAHPYLFMSGGTSFNSELFGSEHLVIDDQCGNSDFKSRQKLKAQFKAITAAGSQQCHPKGKPALTLKPFWRLTVSVNDDPESLLVLPLIGEDLEDKIMIFKINCQDMPMTTVTDDQREEFWRQLMVELPHWLHFLVHCWEIPAELKGNRFGVHHYHNPEIIEAIDGLSPEMKLFDLLEKTFNRFPQERRGENYGENIKLPGGWKGTAAKLETYLMGEGFDTQYEARKLFSFRNACARYLERLTKKYPNIIRRDGRRNNRHHWCIDFRGYSEDEVETQTLGTKGLALSS